MLIPFDPETGTVRSSIKVLIGLCRPPDTLRTGEESIDIRTRQKEHTRKQRELAEERSGETETPALLAITENGVSFIITGRADLVDPGGWVTEIKTAQPLPEKPLSHHILQVHFYFLALGGTGESLLYTDPDTKESREFQIDGEQGREIWNEFIQDVSRFVSGEWERHRKLQDGLVDFTFPFEDRRPGQESIITEVSAACGERGELLLQAPTGTGKTAAVLTGAIPSSVGNWNILFFLTSKNTQKKILMETMDRIIKRGFPLRTIVISSRESSCPAAMERCNPEICPYAEVFGPAIRESGIIDELTAEVLITPELIMEKGEAAGVCPFELSLYLSQRCDLVACDYNYVFDPGIRLKRFFEDDATAARCDLLIDEAANLPERVRGVWSPEIRTSWMETAWRHARGNRRMQNLLRPWRKLLQAYAETPWPHRDDQILLPEEVQLPGIDRRRWQKVMGADRDTPMDVSLLCRAIYGFSRVSERLDERFHLLAVKEGDDTLIQYYCTDPSAFIAEEHTRCSSVSCFSATLEPMEHFATELGLSKERRETAVGWPFPRENLRVWVDAGINTRYRHREKQTEPIARRLAGAMEKTPGTWMAFFPSFAWMEKIALRVNARGTEFIAQKREMTTAEREDFVSSINAGSNLVLAVAGGLFAEGVDLSIPDLRGCFIVGPSLPGVSLKQELLKNRYEATGRNGFLHAFAIPGINRVIQAAGRLIRNPTQQADLVLLGARFIESPYVEHLPDHWFPLRVIRNGRTRLYRRATSTTEP